MHVSELGKVSKNYLSDLILLLQPTLRAEGQNLASTTDRDYELCSRGPAILGPGALDIACVKKMIKWPSCSVASLPVAKNIIDLRHNREIIS